MCVPADRNLHWRYTVLHNAFAFAAQHIPRNGDLDEQVSKLLDSMQWVWEAYNQNIVTINRCERHINANFRLLLQDDKITDTAKSIINGWIKTTENVSGCQALRKIRHI
eukprot:11666428-Karenia_brevis.AAC.1